MVSKVIDRGFVANEVEIVIFPEKQLGAVNARNERKCCRLYVVEHEAIEHSLQCSLVPVGGIGMEKRGDVFKVGGVSSCFVVNDADALGGLVHAVNIPSDVHRMRGMVCFNRDGDIKTAFHGYNMEGGLLFVVFQHPLEVFFDNVEDEFIVPAV